MCSGPRSNTSNLVTEVHTSKSGKGRRTYFLYCPVIGLACLFEDEMASSIWTTFSIWILLVVCIDIERLTEQAPV